MDGVPSKFCRSIVCPHCSQRLSIKTFKAHKRLYFDFESSRWHKKRRVEAHEVDFTDDVFECFDSDRDSDGGDDLENKLPCANRTNDGTPYNLEVEQATHSMFSCISNVHVYMFHAFMDLCFLCIMREFLEHKHADLVLYMAISMLLDYCGQ